MFPAPSFKNSSFIIHALVVGILSVAILSCGGGGGSSNQSPQANAGTDRSAMELSVVNLSGAASSDKDGVINQYLWEQVSPSAPMVTIASANNSSASFTAPDVATATDFQFRLTVTDDAGATNSDTVTIRVTNSLPSATATADAEVYSGETFEMSAATNLGWLYHWEQVSGPSVNLSNPNAADVSVIAPVLLELTPISFRLTVSDAEGNSDDDLVQLNIVRKNPTAIARAGIDRRGATSPAPALDVANVFLNAATSTGLNFSWSVVDMPAGAVYRFTSPNDLVTGFLADVEGDYTLSLAVDNGQGSSHSDSVMVTMLADVDGDGLRDSEDLDLDGDGFVNTEDAFPNDKASHLDTDTNGIGNYYHSDEDGDTVPDIMDDFPLDASKSALTLFSEAKETDVLFNRNDGISVAENAGTAPLSISGFIRAASQSPDLDYYKLTLNAGVFTLVMDEVQGGLKPTVNLVTASGARLATLSQNATGMSTSAYSVTLVPSDGDYYLIIGDSSGSSGDDWLYRIRIQADSDRDGIADDVEMALDINHLTSDSDGDGVNDLFFLCCLLWIAT